MAKLLSLDLDLLKQTIDALDKDDLVSTDIRPSSVSESIVTAQQILNVVDKLKDPAANGGHTRIAHACGVSTGTVRQIIQAVNERLAQLAEL